MHILCPTFGYTTQTIQKTKQTFYAPNVGIANHSNKTNVFFVILIQVFHIELYVFEVF
jgi:hypothetical protein